ncbi:MAG: hypothetical protein FJ403_24185 [Verrucomicrobia bacterium]|nr:hypothetical protein [Verrucomicrobiota bacterium]
MSKPRAADGAWDGRITFLSRAAAGPFNGFGTPSPRKLRPAIPWWSLLPVNEHGSFGLPINALVTASGLY